MPPPLGRESILASSQFLYLVSDAITVITNIGQAERTSTMQEFVRKFIPILLDHYKRWIFDEIGPFQVRGWGCKVKGKYVTTGMNHFEFITKMLKRELGDCDSSGYCNGVTDTDMWIIAGVSNLLAASKKASQLVPIPPEDSERLFNYLAVGLELIKDRFTYKNLKDFEGKPVEGANFYIGVWDDHPEYAYTGYSEEGYPIGIEPQRKKGVGWDLSHARRFVHVFDALFRNKDLLNLEFPTEALMEKLANQLIYGVFNRDFKKPLFTNFMDGTNGWFRVGYNERIGFGYGHWDMSIAVLTGGYGFWAKYNKDVETVFCVLREMLESNDPDVRKHMTEHYEKNYWCNYERPLEFSFEDQENPNTQSVLIQFLPSLCNISDYKGCGNSGLDH